jgi:zinc resistance-associated protein
MSKVTTRRVALAAVIALAGGAALAQTAPPTGGPGGPRGNWQPPSPAVMQRLLDGRIAMMKTALQLTPDQEKLWPAVEKAMRDNAADRAKSMADFRANAPQPGAAPKGPSARLEFMGKMDTTRAQHSQRLADALKPLEATLNDDQKTVLRMVSAGPGGGKGGMGGRGGPRGRF